MREHKYRAWDNLRKEYTYFGLDEYKVIESMIAYTGTFYTKFTIEEFTGLLDKSGKEIYEGDIVRYMDGMNMVVEWSSEGYIGWQLRGKRKMGKSWHHYRYMFYNHQPWPNAAEYVIGNIHQHKHLLETKEDKYNVANKRRTHNNTLAV